MEDAGCELDLTSFRGSGSKELTKNINGFIPNQPVQLSKVTGIKRNII